MDFVSAPSDARDEVIPCLMEEYGDSIMRMCFLYLSDPGLAEDATQETFIKAYQRFHTFQGNSSIKTWLMRIAINTCKDLRNSKWNRTIDPRVALEEVHASYVDHYADDAVLSAIMQMPDKYKTALLLFYYQDMQTNEISETLRISPSAVSSRLLRAKKLLRGKLERWYQDVR